MTRSLILPILISGLLSFQPVVNAQNPTKTLKSESELRLDVEAQKHTSQKPKFGLVVQMSRVGATSTSVGNEFGPYLANFSNRHMEPQFNLDLNTEVYGFSKQGLTSFKSDLNHFMFGPTPLSVSELPHISPPPTYQEASNAPVSIVQALGVGTQFSVEDAKGQTYHITPSVNIFDDMPILSLNIANGIFKKKK